MITELAGLGLLALLLFGSKVSKEAPNTSALLGFASLWGWRSQLSGNSGWWGLETFASLATHGIVPGQVVNGDQSTPALVLIRQAHDQGFDIWGTHGVPDQVGVFIGIRPNDTPDNFMILSASAPWPT